MHKAAERTAIHGNVMIDVAGLELNAEDARRLAHPACGGVILFARNYREPRQLADLVSSMRAAADGYLLVAVDHEGGRVQRFRDGFTRLPPMAWLGRCYERNPLDALVKARELGWLMAAECRQADIDFSFAPVLDLGAGVCEVIGDRAFHADPEAIAALAGAWMDGMHEAGMAAVGKHFPGHGCVVEDSHVALPVDHRDVEAILKSDVKPFASLISKGLEAIMPAHVIYAQADAHAAGFSTFWLQQVLRGRLNFDGVIFSDDLSMAAAGTAGDYAARAHAAIAAGCDMVLVCNQPEAADVVLQALRDYRSPRSLRRLQAMRAGRGAALSDVVLAQRRRRAAALAATGVEAMEQGA
jgi:beta-N-acetylhexosaminidase